MTKYANQSQEMTADASNSGTSCPDRVNNAPQSCPKTGDILYIILHKYLQKVVDRPKYTDIICTVVYITCTKYGRTEKWSLTETSIWT
jgi:hypothetical protein